MGHLRYPLIPIKDLTPISKSPLIPINLPYPVLEIYNVIYKQTSKYFIGQTFCALNFVGQKVIRDSAYITVFDQSILVHSVHYLVPFKI